MAAEKRPKRAFRIIVSLTVLFSGLCVGSSENEVASRNRECFAHGCPNYPRDIVYDSASRLALKDLGDATSEEVKKSALDELDVCGGDDRASLTLIGFKGGSLSNQINQDRAFVISPFVLGGDLWNVTSVLLGVFDGHAARGEIVSQFALEEIPERISKAMESALKENMMSDSRKIDGIVKKILVDTFVQVDKDIPNVGSSCGCTASILLQLGSRLYIANAGDSQTFVVAHVADQLKIVYRTREDKPDLPDERARIEKMGGSVRIPPESDVGDSSRVLRIDPNTGHWYGLAMSRSIGDWEMPGVISEPLVDVIDLKEVAASVVNAAYNTCQAEDKKGSMTCLQLTEDDVEFFAVSATDGLMDYMEPHDISRALAEAYLGKEGIHVLSACNDLISKAAMSWDLDHDGSYRDDIAIATTIIKH